MTTEPHSPVTGTLLRLQWTDTRGVRYDADQSLCQPLAAMVIFDHAHNGHDRDVTTLGVGCAHDQRHVLEFTPINLDVRLWASADDRYSAKSVEFSLSQGMSQVSSRSGWSLCGCLGLGAGEPVALVDDLFGAWG